ncbi:MAG: MraY family glycosyltransferase [Synergistaceae bacterium]|nr:MraY family glycosyltransferase [Synergistaceae bacterium]
MINYIFSILLLFWGLLGTPLAIKLAEDFRAMDIPDARKSHKKITPRGAGIVIWSGYILWALVMAQYNREISFISTSATFIFFIGYVDDMHSLPPLVRLFIQFISAAIVAIPLPLTFFAKLVTLVWITGMINAYNFIDGMDGLCLTISFLTSIASLFFFHGISIWLPLASVIFGVLFWNFPKPKTFLGDGGSTLLGFICASHIAWSISNFSLRNSYNILIFAFVLLFLGGIPVIDTLVAMTRRILHKKSPFLPDRGHTHHKLQDAGFSKPATLFIMSTIHVLFLFLGKYFFSLLL